MKPTATTYAKIIQRYSLPAVHSHSIESSRISLFHTPPYLSYPSSHRNSLHTSCSYFLMQLSFRSIIHFRTDSGKTFIQEIKVETSQVSSREAYLLCPFQLHISTFTREKNNVRKYLAAFYQNQQSHWMNDCSIPQKYGVP